MRRSQVVSAMSTQEEEDGDIRDGGWLGQLHKIDESL
jgi:hypothetical protein